ncbi:hypothetical protein D049_3299B, partial [Vibrio parahaemolyticus VPTS-2010]
LAIESELLRDPDCGY